MYEVVSLIPSITKSKARKKARRQERMAGFKQSSHKRKNNKRKP
jgi:hypothetical protein